MRYFKFLFAVALFCTASLLAGCSTNPATGKEQFTALMSPAQENEVGASEHQQIIEQFGLYKDPALQSYVNEIGHRVTQNTERPDVRYKFFIIDSPIVNAFALPGGYIYVSRGLLALANSEAELAAVLAHETGHITGRHSAERYSRGVVTSLGAGLLAAVLDAPAASDALSLGANLYLTSYSRDQEREADSLGLRYMTRGGYDRDAMPAFLASLQQESALESRLAGRGNGGDVSYFSTHPATGERVAETRAQGQAYQPGGANNRERHLKAIDGMIYGDSAEQGFAQGGHFYHPGLGFTFDIPKGFKIDNQPGQIIMAGPSSDALVIFDIGGNPDHLDPLSYLRAWAEGKPTQDAEGITINGRRAATASFDGNVNGKDMTIRLVAIEWEGGFARF
ncbi:MAG: M48 family metalloprotease, partial [Magnetococcus sp. WYHC-3]